jgi:nucleotide-binding universal stress UspA family protein
MFKKILVPLDGSKLAETILPQVEELAKCHGAAITLITIGNYGEIFEASPAIIDEALEQTKLGAQEYLGNIADSLKGKGLAADWAYREGITSREIIAYAAGNNIDLIAMATHGKGEVAWVLGSVAEKVVSHAAVPVLLFRVMKTKMPLLKEEFFMGA